MKNQNVKKGMIHIIFAAFGFATMSVFIRLSGNLPTMQKVFFRNLFSLLIAYSTIRKQHTNLTIPKQSRPTMLLRCVFGGTAMIANFYAIDHLGIADASMLNKLAPFFAIIASYIILKEKPTKLDWTSLTIAFLGSLFIIKPTNNLSLLPSLIALYGGLGAGAAYTFVRKMGQQNVKGVAIVFYFSLFCTLLTLPYTILQWQPLTIQQFLCLLGSGIAAAIGQFNVTTAYQSAKAKDISIFDYTQVLFAAIYGLVLFQEIPDHYSLIGYAIILSSAIYKWQITRKQTPVQ